MKEKREPSHTNIRTHTVSYILTNTVSYILSHTVFKEKSERAQTCVLALP